MRIEITEEVKCTSEGAAKVVCRSIAQWQGPDLRVERESRLIFITGITYGGRNQDKVEKMVEDVKKKAEKLSEEAAQYEWLRPMFTDD